MRFTDEQTELAIRIVSGVRVSSGQPLPEPDLVAEHKRRADAGDIEAYVAWMTASLRMIYPVVGEEAPAGLFSGASPRTKLWKSILDGRLEGIRIAKSLNYGIAWQETQGGTKEAPLGSYFDSFCNTAVRNELIRSLLD